MLTYSIKTLKTTITILHNICLICEILDRTIENKSPRLFTKMIIIQFYFEILICLLNLTNACSNFLTTNIFFSFNVTNSTIYQIYTTNIDMFAYIVNPIKTNKPYANNICVYMAHTLNQLCYKHALAIYNVIANCILFVAFYLLFFSIFFKLIKKFSNIMLLFQRLVKENDQEVVSFEDIIIYVVFFFSFFINIFNIYTFNELIDISFNCTIWLLFFCFFSMVIIVPINILWVAGSNLFVYLKGVEKANSFIFLTISDLITLLAFFLRFILQIIRWALFLTTFYLLHEFIFEIIYNNFFNIIELNNNNKFYLFLNNNVFAQTIISFIRFSFELLDTCLILLIQITAFVAVVLWLFNYLFSLSNDNIYETNFK